MKPVGLRYVLVEELEGAAEIIAGIDLKGDRACQGQLILAGDLSAIVTLNFLSPPYHTLCFSPSRYTLGEEEIYFGTMSPQLTAHYAAPALETRKFTSPLPTLPPSPTTSDRTAFLEVLQKGVVGLQLDINEFLTKKMDEDNKASGKLAAEEAKEEENYGEEVVEED
ncbi:hypothetical protein BU16DRAFT_559658 [Lophium mytilinum]|uniref:EKC/KEOPS complex subunit GON7 n=1 Tax=Lophium mytilinum TaxID=390894 RepID=A0A6A6R087_9PEZI|nr:hypothetical protein BU16DRAFT_559658 [Lophium mytilinum]